MSEALPLPKSTGVSFSTGHTTIENKDIKICADEKLELCSDDMTLNGLQWPNSDGAFNYVLGTDGDGHLSFRSVESVSATDQIVDASGTTKVQTEKIPGDRTITHTADNKVVLVSTVDDTTSYNPFYFESRVEFKIRESKIASDTVLPDDIFIRWDGPSSGSVALPLAAQYTGRPVIIENVSTLYSLQVVRTGSDTINGDVYPIVLSSRYSHVSVVGDGSSNWLIT